MANQKVYAFASLDDLKRVQRSVRATEGAQAVDSLHRAQQRGAGEVYRVLVGKTDAAISKGSSGTVSIYYGALGSETDTGDNVTAFTRFGDVGAAKWVHLVELPQGYDITAAEC